MKICWDNLEKVWLSKYGNLKIGTTTYIEKKACKVCGDSYLTLKYEQSNFCSYSCFLKMKSFSKETRKKISDAVKGKNHPMYGKHHSVETKKKMSVASANKVLSLETRRNLSRILLNRKGPLSRGYKGGVTKLGLTTYNTHKNTLGLYEDIRKQEGTEILEVRCAYCNKWYTPTSKSVEIRFRAINSLNHGESRLYCSENCKQSCPTFGRSKYPKGFKKATSREVSTYLRQMVFERDNWECQKCGKNEKEAQLHCHHIKGYAQNKILANDVDNCITLCKDCHKKVHKQHGCRYIDLQCKQGEL